MTEEPSVNRGVLSPRKLAIQLVGFVIGVGLLVWCIAVAFGGESDAWQRLADAEPWWVAGLVGCSVVSMFVNGLAFWLVVQPVRRLRFWDMQWLNLVTAVLNYAPIRAGLIARVAYHLRVDRMSVLEIGGYLAAVAYTLVLTVGACILATIVRPSLDWLWVALLLGQLGLGGLLTRALMSQQLVVRVARGMDAMLRLPGPLWGAIGLRLLDVGAFIGRMTCAAAILELSLTFVETTLLGLAAIALSLNPLGRTGFREIAVAFVASRMLTSDLTGSLDSTMATLALVESAGEALVGIPCGSVCFLFWYRRRWSAAGAGRTV